MLLISGHAGGTDLTGTLYERGERSPSFKGAPDEDAPYIWVCDSFYEVESGGQQTEIDGRQLNVAFESPMPHGFETREQAIDAAEEHIRTQFARVGLDPAEVDIDVVQAESEAN
ncbi:YfdX family protein [Halorientalis brevis]|uniref:YfdX family protein n=1 Tax=Halorientalis brevis TaxID=1126241 RepID=A0ABD6C6A4_9EURY|nr:YfdX family protein [Halorientalis brevis]